MAYDKHGKKSIRRYFRRGLAGGRSALARAVDYMALRLLILAGAFLFFRQRVTGLWWALLLAVLSLLLGIVLLHIVYELRFERYVFKEMRRLRQHLLCQKIALMDKTALLPIAQSLAGGESPALLFCAEPASADALLPLARKKDVKAVCATGGYSPAAERFAAQAGLWLIPQGALLEAATREGLAPGDREVYRYILTEDANRRKKRLRLSGLLFSGGAAKKYLVTGLVLLALSFLSRYTLYYRLLATVCMSIFSVNFLMDRTRKAGFDIE